MTGPLLAILLVFYAVIQPAFGRVRKAPQLVGDGQIVLISSKNYPGCIEPKDGNTDGNKVFLEQCDDSGGWFVEMPDGTGPYMFKNRRDPSKCLQSGWGDGIADHTRLRLVECDTDNPYQRFLWEYYRGGPLKAAFRGNFCVVFRGRRARVGRDPIIIKHCQDIKQDRLPWVATFVGEEPAGELTLFAKYDWMDGAKDVSGVRPSHDGMLEEDVTAEKGTLSVYNDRGVNLGYLTELDGEKSVLFRFEDVSIKQPFGYSVFMGGGYEQWWVGIYRDIAEWTNEENRESHLVFNIGGWGNWEEEEAFELKVPLEDKYMTFFDSIEYRFDGCEAPNKRLSIRYNDGDWSYGGGSSADFYPVFPEANQDFEHVKINDGARADWDHWNGTLGTTYLWATL